MADSGDIYGGESQNGILYDPQQKKGKRGMKKGIFGFEWKSSKIFENEKKNSSQDMLYPFYPFYPFWWKYVRILNFPFFPNFILKNLHI